MLAIAAALTLGLVALAFIVTALQHAGDPGKYGPAGGLQSYQDAIEVVGADGAHRRARSSARPPASQDIESGVFRDLAATGRSRMALFTARVAGAWAVVLPIAAITAAATAAPSVALAGSLRRARAPARSLAGTAVMLVAAALSTASPSGCPRSSARAGRSSAILLGFFLAVAAAAVGHRLPRRRPPGAPDVGAQPHRRPADRRRAAPRWASPSRSSSRGSPPRSRPAHGAPATREI